MKSRIQWCKTFCHVSMSRGHWRSKTRILYPLFYCHPTPARFYSQKLEAVYGWGLQEHIRKIDVTSGGRTRAEGMVPNSQNLFCSNIIMLHIKSKVMKSRIQWCKTFAPGICLGVTKGQKVGLWVLFFYCHPTPQAILARTLTLSRVIAL